MTESLYDHLLGTVDTTLASSRKSFTTEEAIKECYGDDASMFEDFEDGSSDNNNSNFLASAIDAMVDQVNSKVKSDMLEFLQEEKVEDRLNDVEEIINELNNHDRVKKEADEADRKSARNALETARLPKDVQPPDILRYETHRLMTQEKESLLAELSKIEVDVEELDNRIKESGGKVDEGVQALQTAKQNLQKSAGQLEESKNEQE